jgi:hypothetical protein
MGKLFSLAIVYTPDGGRPLSLARVSDRFLLGCAAAAALRESEQQAECLMVTDPVLGLVQTEETARLRRILNLLIASEHDHLM